MKISHLHPSSSLGILSCSVAIFGLLTLGPVSRAMAESLTWAYTGASGDLSDPASWKPAVAPGPNDTVVVTGSGFSDTVNVRATAEVRKWIYNSGIDNGLSVLGRGSAGSIVGLTISDALTKSGGGTLTLRDQGATRKLDARIGTVNVSEGILFFGSKTDVITSLDVTTALLGGGTTSLRPANGATVNIANINFTGDATLDLHGTGFGESSTLRVTALSSSGSIGTITTAAGNTGVMQLNNATGGTSAYHGVIAGAGTSLQKQGAGVQILTGSNSYGGGTLVNEGTLVINNTAGSGTGLGAVTVNAGGTLAGSGFIGGAVSTQSAGPSSFGTLAAGFGAAGVLTIQSTLTLGDNTHLALALDAPDSAGGTAGNALLAVLGTTGANGDLSLGSDVVLDLVAGVGFGPGTYDLIQFTGLLAGTENLASWTIAGLSQPYAFGADANSVYLVVSAVPEPGTTTLLLGAAAGLFWGIRLRRKLR